MIHQSRLAQRLAQTPNNELHCSVRIHRDPRHVLQNTFVETVAKRKIVKAGRRFGKTIGAARIAVQEFLKGRRILYGAPTVDQLERFWTEVNWSLEDPINTGLYRKNETEHSIELPRTEQRIRAKTMWNADTARGDYADTLILDEFQLMHEDTWDRVGHPMMLDRNGDAVFIFTPPSLTSRTASKATDPRHASKMFKKALAEMKQAAAEGRQSFWLAVHATSHDNPILSRDALDEIAGDMTSLAYRQEIMADDDDEVPGALWKRAMLDRNRVIEAPELLRVVVGVDPPGGKTECGIVTAGIGRCRCKGREELHGFVIADDSERNTPEGWAMTTNNAYERAEADAVIAEKNYGGDMVVTTLHTANPQLPVKVVHASRGKAVRAEPISALDEKGRIHHVGPFSVMEDEMVSWVPGTPGPSPNRMDARVWALTALMLGNIQQRKRPRAW
jgi:hypothetical protein